MGTRKRKVIPKPHWRTQQHAKQCLMLLMRKRSNWSDSMCCVYGMGLEGRKEFADFESRFRCLRLVILLISRCDGGVHGYVWSPCVCVGSVINDVLCFPFAHDLLSERFI